MVWKVLFRVFRDTCGFVCRRGGGERSELRTESRANHQLNSFLLFLSWSSSRGWGGLLDLLGHLLHGDAVEVYSGARLWLALLVGTNADQVVVDSAVDAVLNLNILLWKDEVLDHAGGEHVLLDVRVDDLSLGETPSDLVDWDQTVAVVAVDRLGASGVVLATSVVSSLNRHPKEVEWDRKAVPTRKSAPSKFHTIAFGWLEPLV